MAKVIFLHLFVILFTGGGVPDQVHPPGTRYTPPDQVHPPGPGTPPRGPGTPPNQVHPPRTRYPPWGQVHPPGTRYTPQQGTPPQAANSGIRSTIGRYTSYWNAFLFSFSVSIKAKILKAPSGICWQWGMSERVYSLYLKALSKFVRQGPVHHQLYTDEMNSVFVSYLK